MTLPLPSKAALWYGEQVSAGDMSPARALLLAGFSTLPDLVSKASVQERRGNPSRDVTHRGTPRLQRAQPRERGGLARGHAACRAVRSRM